MPNISDTEILHDLMTNDSNKTPGLKTIVIWDPALDEQVTLVVDVNDELCCPGCLNLCNFAVCGCGYAKHNHAEASHTFHPMGCTCGYEELPSPIPPPAKLCDWDIL